MKCLKSDPITAQISFYKYYSLVKLFSEALCSYRSSCSAHCQWKCWFFLSQRVTWFQLLSWSFKPAALVFYRTRLVTVSHVTVKKKTRCKLMMIRVDEINRRKRISDRKYAIKSVFTRTSWVELYCCFWVVVMVMKWCCLKSHSHHLHHPTALKQFQPSNPDPWNNSRLIKSSKPDMGRDHWAVRLKLQIVSVIVIRGVTVTRFELMLLRKFIFE